MSMPKHLYALFSSKDDAIAAYNALLAEGCPGEHCSVLLHEGQLTEDDLGPVESASREGVRTGALVGGATGAAISGLVAATGGLLGVGFLTAMAVGGGIMAFYGALLGGIAGSGDPERHVRALERALEEGEILIAAKIDDRELAGACEEILHAHGGRSIAAAVADHPGPPLSPAERADLLAALDDEHKAYATYAQVLADFGEVRPFSNIAESERRHIDALARLMSRHGVEVPPNPWPGRVPRFRSVQEACEAAVSAEIENAALYQRLLAGTTRPDVLAVYRHLHEASQERHLAAFRRCAARADEGEGGPPHGEHRRWRGGRG